jgi:glutamate 5-kinase
MATLDFSGKKRIVIKVGTSSLTYNTGSMNLRRVESLIRVISDIRNSGREIVFVTSGAVGVGMSVLGLREKPSDMPGRQACAAVGQCELMRTYNDLFSRYNHTPAQLLLTRDVFSNKERRQNAVNTFMKLLEMGIIPVVNANDSVSIDHLDFDENDTLSAWVALLCEADLLVIFTDVPGLYDRDPKEPDAKFIPTVKKITSEMIASVGEKGSALSSGGMLTKLEAADIALHANIPAVFLGGETPEILYDLFDNKAVCTEFIP